jgi:hypothetical protein|eukprot:COSAG06_NODE_16797_length_980_cov_1.422247_1_plen_95_part_00
MMIYQDRLGTNARKIQNKDGVSQHSDMGQSWYGFRNAPELPDPGAKGGITAWPKRKALLFTNNADSVVGMRLNITLRASFDDGKTWPTQLPIGT